MKLRVLAPITASLAVALTPATSNAQSKDAGAAEGLFRDARTSFEAGDFRQACPKFAESLRLDFAVGTLLNLALCEEQIGAIASAWVHYSEVADRVPADDGRHRIAAERVAYLDPIVPRLSVSLASPYAPPSTHVTRDGVDLEAPSLGVALPVEVGDHVIVVTSPGHDERRWTVHVARGDHQAITVAPGGSSTLRTAGWVVGGVGVASLAVGSYFGVTALSKRSESDANCNAGICQSAAGTQAYDDARASARVADIALGVGIAAVAVAVYLVVVKSHGDSSSSSLRATAGGLGGVW